METAEMDIEPKEMEIEQQEEEEKEVKEAKKGGKQKRGKGKKEEKGANVADTAYETAGAGAAMSVPTQCSSLKKGQYVLINEHPCQIKEMSTSKTGKHGHAKVKLVGLDIFTGKKYEAMSPSTHTMQVPTVTKMEMMLSDMADGCISALDSHGNMHGNLTLAETCSDTFEELQAKFDKISNSDDMNACVNVIVTDSMDSQLITEVKLTSIKNK